MYAFLLLCLVSSLKTNLVTAASECKQLLSTQWTHDNYQRSYTYYYPSILCDTSELHSFLRSHTNYAISMYNKVNLPILLAIHGYTDNPVRFLSHWKWQQYAEQYGYILLAPRGGVNNASVPSWNAQSCCGDNLQQNIDDVGFVRELIYKFIRDTTLEFPFLDITATNIILFITGHSNGAFLQDKLAWTYAANSDSTHTVHTGFPFTITAVSPISAFIYDNQEFMPPSTQQSVHNKVSIFYQHGDNDSSVDHIGCGCPNAQCCCDIIQHSTKCVSLQQAYQRWLHWNGHTEILQRRDVYNDGKQETQCTWNSDGNNGYLTGMCIWTNANHRVHKNKHVEFDVLKTKTNDFFLHALCIRRGFQWSTDRVSCICNANENDSQNTEIYYCSSSGSGPTLETQMEHTTPSNSAFAIALVIATFGMAVLLVIMSIYGSIRDHSKNI